MATTNSQPTYAALMKAMEATTQKATQSKEAAIKYLESAGIIEKEPKKAETKSKK